MDLSNLSSDLPITKNLEQTSLLELNRELTSEFKNAAKSVAALYNSTGDAKQSKTEFSEAAKAVASLYRLGTNSNVISMHRGYLECLDDLLGVIANGDDIENWALTKRAEITKNSTSKEKSNTSFEAAQDSAQYPPQGTDFVLPSEHDFCLDKELASSLHFRPTFTPLSVNYRRPRSKESRRRDRTGLRKHLAPSAHDGSQTSDNDSEASDSGEDASTKKRRALQTLTEAAKRRRLDSSSDND